MTNDLSHFYTRSAVRFNTDRSHRIEYAKLCTLVISITEDRLRMFIIGQPVTPWLELGGWVSCHRDLRLVEERP